MKALVALLLIFCTASLLAGGVSWSVRVKAVTFESNAAERIELVPIEADGPFSGCERVVIRATLAKGWPGPEDAFPTEASHLEALKFLKAAASSREAIRFGAMGSGLHQATSASRCEFQSEGLRLLTEHGGGVGVYSFYRKR